MSKRHRNQRKRRGKSDMGRMPEKQKPAKKMAQKPGAAISPVSGGVTRRLYAAAEWSLGALRWAGHMIQTARGKNRNE